MFDLRLILGVVYRIFKAHIPAKSQTGQIREGLDLDIADSEVVVNSRLPLPREVPRAHSDACSGQAIRCLSEFASELDRKMWIRSISMRKSHE